MFVTRPSSMPTRPMSSFADGELLLLPLLLLLLYGRLREGNEIEGSGNILAKRLGDVDALDVEMG